MPLSEEELRLLEQMERALVAEDPKLASTLRGTRMRQHARRQMIAGVLVFVVGIAVLMSGAVLQIIPLGIVGFVVMLGSAYFTLTSWRGQSQRRAPAAARGSAPATRRCASSRAARPAAASASRQGAPKQRLDDGALRGALASPPRAERRCD